MSWLNLYLMAAKITPGWKVKAIQVLRSKVIICPSLRGRNTWKKKLQVVEILVPKLTFFQINNWFFPPQLCYFSSIPLVLVVTEFGSCNKYIEGFALLAMMPCPWFV